MPSLFGGGIFIPAFDEALIDASVKLREIVFLKPEGLLKATRLAKLRT